MTGVNNAISGVRIGGVEATPADAHHYSVHNPADGSTIAVLHGGKAPDARAAIAAARQSQLEWSSASAADRSLAMMHIATELRDPETASVLAQAITRETGKLISEARAEVVLSARFFEWFGSAIRGTREDRWHVSANLEHSVRRYPIGIVAVLTSWNFPLSIPARKIAPALAAGCPVLFKPSEVAPTPALLLASLVEKYVPAGAMNTVIGEPEEVPYIWLADPFVRGLTFTGSTRVGKILAARCAPSFKRCVFELGGSAPFIVLNGADLEKAVDVLMVAKYRNNGQSCIAANEVFVPAKMVDTFAKRFAARSSELVLGDPFEDNVTLGPLAIPSDPQRIAELVTDAESTAVSAPTVSAQVPSVGYFAAPQVVVDPDPDSRIRREEVFGPAVSVNGYGAIDEVLDRVQNSAYGLAGYVVGPRAAASDVAQKLDVGIVGVNNATPNTPEIPFGGLKQSGYGWEGGELGLEAFLTRRSIAIAN